MSKKFRCVSFDLGKTLIFYRVIPMSWVALYPEALRSVAVLDIAVAAELR